MTFTYLWMLPVCFWVPKIKHNIIYLAGNFNLSLSQLGTDKDKAYVGNQLINNLLNLSNEAMPLTPIVQSATNTKQAVGFHATNLHKHADAEQPLLSQYNNLFHSRFYTLNTLALFHGRYNEFFWVRVSADVIRRLSALQAHARHSTARLSLWAAQRSPHAAWHTTKPRYSTTQ